MAQVAQAITLSGSVATVTEYFGFSINSILYQRGIYPAEDFQQVRKYGLPLMVSTHAELNAYLAEMLQQIADWISSHSCRRVALLLVNPDSGAVLERWEFHITDSGAGFRVGVGPRKVSEEEVREEVRTVLRQITASVSYLPPLPEGCAFDLLVYTAMDAAEPSEAWEATAPRGIPEGCQVKLRRFSTGHHIVDTSVAYRQ